MKHRPSPPAQCDICGTPQPVFLGEKHGYSMFRCSSCGCMFPHPVPAPEDTISLYQESYFQGSSEGAGYVDYDRDKQPMIPTFEKYLNIIEQAIPEKGTLLDIGAATGFFLKLADVRQWKTIGVEPSPYASAQARSAGLDVRTAVFDSTLLPPQSVDVVTMWDVIEHVHKPQAVLEAVHGVLRPGGLLALNTPDSDSAFARLLKTRWHLAIPPEHIYLLNARALEVLFKATSFRTLTQQCIGKHFTVQYVLDTLARWQGLSLWRGLHRRVEGTALGHFSIPINLHDNFFVLAKKDG